MSSEQVAGGQIRSIVERIEAIQTMIDEHKEEQNEVYAEAKGNGLDVKVLRETIRLRKMDADERSEREALVDLYMGALGEAK